MRRDQAIEVDPDLPGAAVDLLWKEEVRRTRAYVRAQFEDKSMRETFIGEIRGGAEHRSLVSRSVRFSPSSSVHGLLRASDFKESG